MSADTAHLSAAQFGNHGRLLMLAWRRHGCSIPDDRGWITRRLQITAEEYDRDVAPVLAELWESDGEDYSNEALRKERFHAETTSEKRRQAALIRHHGDNVRPLKTNEKR